jgi:hypothetical protein
MTMLDTSDHGWHVCRRCDTAPYDPHGVRSAGPPNLPGADENGIFVTLPGWSS